MGFNAGSDKSSVIRDYLTKAGRAAAAAAGRLTAAVIVPAMI
jgi:hypothetical protein